VRHFRGMHEKDIGMGIGKETGTIKGLKKAKEAYKQQQLKEAQLEQLTWLNQELLQRLQATEKSHRSLMSYIKEMHQNLESNFHRTPIEEIWYRELTQYLKQQERL